MKMNDSFKCEAQSVFSSEPNFNMIYKFFTLAVDLS